MVFSWYITEISYFTYYVSIVPYYTCNNNYDMYNIFLSRSSYVHIYKCYFIIIFFNNYITLTCFNFKLMYWSAEVYFFNLAYMLWSSCLFLQEKYTSVLYFFELSLLPILLMIISWGYQPERVQAGIYMVMYTVLGSMPLLVSIFFLYTSYMSLNIHYLVTISPYIPYGLAFMGFIAFFVKLPVYGVHIWLPKAHVEAPLGGSMLLAGVLLKLGGYGLYIYSNIMTISMTSWGLMFLVSLALWGGSLAAWMCFNQNDIKALIAYSSVVHMSIVVLGFLTCSPWGYSSSVITMVAHGWVSSGLFLLAYITYKIVGSRSFCYTKGLLQVIPVLSMAWFIYCIWNMAVPPTINLMGELAAVPVSFMLSVQLLMVVLVLMFLSVGYNMYLYTYINHGSISTYTVSHKMVSCPNLLALVGHLMPLVFLFNMDLLCF
uniref:NADH-ubiquinone oxidoreductase chain 4 n=1 Tax=Cornu aspersum TaxID=6535 RepID=S4SAI8_CORAP|nr:NADH dehydrogenase subunit 4 [Cornu aspersum]